MGDGLLCLLLSLWQLFWVCCILDTYGCQSLERNTLPITLFYWVLTGAVLKSLNSKLSHFIRVKSQIKSQTNNVATIKVNHSLVVSHNLSLQSVTNKTKQLSSQFSSHFDLSRHKPNSGVNRNLLLIAYTCSKVDLKLISVLRTFLWNKASLYFTFTYLVTWDP